MSVPLLWKRLFTYRTQVRAFLLVQRHVVLDLIKGSKVVFPLALGPIAFKHSGRKELVDTEDVVDHQLKEPLHCIDDRSVYISSLEELIAPVDSTDKLDHVFYFRSDVVSERRVPGISNSGIINPASLHFPASLLCLSRPVEDVVFSRCLKMAPCFDWQ